jgi:hypothetical protein
MRFVLYVLRLLYKSLLLLFTLPCLLLFFASTTSTSNIISVGLLALLFLLLFYYPIFKNRKIALLLPFCLLLFFTSIFFPYFNSPNPQKADFNNSFSSNYKEKPPSRLSPSNLVPEVDQLLMGLAIVRFLDPFIDNQQTVQLKKMVLEIYKEMENDPEFPYSSSSLGYAYQEILTGQRIGDHFYQYLPNSNSQKPYPVIPFLNGSMGNFKAYSWIWKHIADETGYAIIAPTYGAGNWYNPRFLSCKKITGCENL